jgi:hypothetical protein
VSFEPFMFATFCDDVRQEVGNKLSYMGIYGTNLVVPSFPTTLVKLCCVFTVRIPASTPPRTVLFRLLRDDEVIFEADLSAATAGNPALEVPPAVMDARALTISTVAQFVSFSVTQPSTLRARAIVDGKELRGGGLELQAAAAAPTH